MENKKRKQIILSVVGILLLVVATVGITYAFFNYTRTGAPNNISTGTINFSTGETNTINLTNVFPISSTSAATDNVNSSEVTITVTGDTTYNKGIEYLVTMDDVTSVVNEKKIPISVVVTPEKTGDLGEVATDYWTQRGSTTSYYSVLSSKAEGIGAYNGKDLLVGYIAPGVTGINGTIGIRAYLDKNRIAISDTYPEGKHYEVNSNLTQAQVDECVSYLSGISATEAFCRGTGTITRYGTNYTILEAIDTSWVINNTQKEHLISEGIIKESYTDGTTSTWVNGRTVLTTTEWNSLQSTPLSFKVKVEANEDVWVKNTNIFESSNSSNIFPTVSTWGNNTQYGIKANFIEGSYTQELGLSFVENNGTFTFDGYSINTYITNDVSNGYESHILFDKLVLTFLPEKCQNAISEPLTLEIEYDSENNDYDFSNVDFTALKNLIIALNG